MELKTYSGKKYKINYDHFSSKDHPALDPSIDLGPNQPIMTKEDLARAEANRKKRLDSLLSECS